MIHAFLFDMDGVLTDTHELHYQSWQRLADEEGIPFNRELGERLRGLARRESLSLFASDRQLSEAQVIDWMARKNAYFHELLNRMTPRDTLPGVRELLNEVRAAGYIVAVASSSRNTGPVLVRLELCELIDHITDGNDVERGKPAPDLFLLAANEIGCQADECIVVEDSPAGVAAARAAQMRVVGLGPDERLAGANLILPSLAGVRLAQLLEWLGEQNPN